MRTRKLRATGCLCRSTSAQLSVPEKTNEIAAIPELLDQLAETKRLEGALVIIDAMGRHVEIADYLLALEANRPTLEADVVSYFENAPAEELVGKPRVEKGQGRVETRTYTASSVVDWIVSDRSYPGQPRFTDVKTISKVRDRIEYPHAPI